MLSLWAIDNLMTHIMAMALYIDDFSVDTEDLKDDFRLTPLKAMELFRSIGCKVNAPTDREKAQLKLTTIEARNRKFARLVIPLDFPQDRKMQKRAKN
jgi:DNA-directed RNA polymerase I subunit RPA49